MSQAADVTMYFKFTDVDLTIMHAGIVRTADFLEMSDTDFDEVLDINLKGVFIVSRGCLETHDSIA